jgi:hypothetical protein
MIEFLAIKDYTQTCHKRELVLKPVVFNAFSDAKKSSVGPLDLKTSSYLIWIRK